MGMMNWKDLVKVTLLGSSLIFMGCGDDDGGTTAETGPTPEMGTGMETGGGEEMAMSMPLAGQCAAGSCFFVAATANAPETVDDSGARAGRNIDGAVSTAGGADGCGVADFSNRFGEAGVDNQLSVLLPMLAAFAPDLDAEAAFRDAVNSGDIIILMELTGADGTEDDTVSGNVFFGSVPGGGAPTTEGDPLALAAGQTFDIDTSVGPFPFNGSITGGAVTADLGTLSIELPIVDPPLTIEVLETQLRADITANGLERGEISGTISVPFLTAAIAGGDDCTMDAQCISGGGCGDDMTCNPSSLLDGVGVGADLVGGVLEQTADSDLDAPGDCLAISLALTFEGVDATRGADI